jgi:predicted transcriptional regulator
MVASTEDDLVAIGQAIREAEEQLSELRLIRETIVEAAVVEGMSQRQIAELLGITHTGVQKILQEREWFRRTVDELKAEGFNAG